MLGGSRMCRFYMYSFQQRSDCADWNPYRNGGLLEQDVIDNQSGGQTTTLRLKRTTAHGSKGCDLIKSGRTYVRYKAPTNNIGSEILCRKPKSNTEDKRARQNLGHKTTYEHIRGEMDLNYRPEGSNLPYSESQSQLPTPKVTVERYCGPTRCGDSWDGRHSALYHG